MEIPLCCQLLGGVRMEFKDIIEFMTIEHVLEGIGVIVGFGLLWEMFFGGGINGLLQILLSVT